MSGMPGLGVMLQMLGGNESTIKAVRACLGKKIRSVELKDEVLRLTMADGSVLCLTDNGQSCCESRYMTCDDDLTNYTNTVLKTIELSDAPDRSEGSEEHNCQFLKIVTGKGTITAESHVEYNGYYGGFSIVASRE